MIEQKMLSRKNLLKSVKKLDAHHLIDVCNLDDFVSFDVINGYDGRVKSVLKLMLNKREYLMFRFLCSELFIDTFKERYESRISIFAIMFSSKPEDHTITIDGREFFLTGDDDSFNSQFKEEIRNDKIDDILNND